MKHRPLLRDCLALAAALLFLAGPLAADEVRNVKVGEPLPPFNLPGLDGAPVKSADLSGNVLVLVYLSARQKQSEEALAGAERVIGRLERQDVKLVALAADAEQADYFRELRTRLGVEAPVGLDEKREYLGQLGLIVYPTTLVVSKDGRLVHVIASWTREYDHHLEVYCRHALGELNEEQVKKRLAAGPHRKDLARIKAERHRSVAAVYRSKGMIDEAVRELEQALVADPTCADAVGDLVDILVARGELDAAEQRVQALLEQQPDCRGAGAMLGLIALKRGNLDEAEKLLKDALVLNPDPVRANYYLGQLYEQKGDYKQAMEHYRDALKHALKEP